MLKSESKKKVTENARHTVVTGKWVSPYDGKTVTVASKLDIDHLVPLEEAWASEAYAWSAKKREAYANDLGYGPSIIAVTQHANRSKGDREPNAYLPTLSSRRCAYVRNWIAVKYRWALSVNSAEKTALTSDLTAYCTSNDWVKTPGKPKISALVPPPKPSAGAPVGQRVRIELGRVVQRRLEFDKRSRRRDRDLPRWDVLVLAAPARDVLASRWGGRLALVSSEHSARRRAAAFVLKPDSYS